MPRPWCLPASFAIAGSVLLCAPQVVLAQATEPIAEATGESSETPVSYSHDPMAPRAQTVRTAQPIVIDGLLDEGAWMTAPAITEFLQTIPDEGQPVSEETEVRLLYDDDYIYVGAWLWDEGEVFTRLARRDAVVPDADFFAVLFDSYHDHRTAYRFGTWPSGVKKDLIIIAGGGLRDTSWDPVWDLETTIPSGIVGQSGSTSNVGISPPGDAVAVSPPLQPRKITRVTDARRNILIHTVRFMTDLPEKRISAQCNR